MKRLALAALAAIACSAITLSAQAAPISGVGKLAAASRSRVSSTMFGGAIVTTIARCSGIVATAAFGDNQNGRRSRASPSGEEEAPVLRGAGAVSFNA